MTLAARVEAAVARGTALRIRGAGSKDFYGQALAGDVLDLSEHAGIVGYEPTELVVTARAGTPLAELEAVLAGEGQGLGFEPPRFGGHGTVGGAVAAGLSGPRRMAAGAVRDFVLGVQMIDGRGRVLRFGGQVMKNVAGYDVSRLMAGSLGTLGVLLEVSLKVLPRPPAEATLRFDCAQDAALQRVLARGTLPVAASAWHAGRLSLRLAGAGSAVRAACRVLGGEPLAEAAATAFWDSLRDHTHPFFAGPAPLWRLALPATTAVLDADTLVEWHGAQRWLRGEAPGVRERAAEAGGHATLFRADADAKRRLGVFTPLPPPLLALQRRVKAAFDPHGCFGPGRLYAEP